MRIARRAMTLVELLVVIAIIGVLVSLLLPAVQSARAAVRSTQCKSQMRQIGIATLQYCDAHDGQFPDWVHTKGAKSWIFTLAPYMENVDAVRACPEDPKAKERLEALATSYVVNDFLTADYLIEEQPDVVRNLRQLSATSRTLFLFEIAEAMAPDPKHEHIHAVAWFAPLNVLRGEVMKKIREDIQIDRHAEVANYLYVDAHVDVISVDQVQAWVDEGFNFAKPQ